MIDWLRFEVRGVLHRPISAGAVAAFTPDGVLEWHTVRALNFAGSASDTVRVRSTSTGPDGLASVLCVEGNPSKFTQGHNLDGSDDLPALVYELAARSMVHGAHELAAQSLTQPDPCELAATLHALAYAVTARPRDHETVRSDSSSWKGRTARPVATLPGQARVDIDTPHVRLQRVDVTYMADLGTDSAVREWIGHAQRFATLSNRPGTLSGDSTVYFGKSKSERARLKFYAKGPEFAVHPPRSLRNTADDQQPLAYRERALLETHAAGKLRAELELRWKGLEERGLRYAADWNSLTARRAWCDFMETFDMPTPPDTLDTSALPTNLALALHAWRCGEDLRARYTLRHWYRLRKQLRELTGFDIAQPCSDPRPLELPAVTLPARAWPRNVAELFPADDAPPAELVARGLYFEPRADWRIEHRPAPHLPPPYRPAYCPWPRDASDRRAVA
jgi:hypothetical protein